jgi:cap1 methyltransferase
LPDDKFVACYGLDETGDIYSLTNVNDYCKKVLSEGLNGVNICLCDGGFSVYGTLYFNYLGDEGNQEEHSRQLLLSQILITLNILKIGGNAVFKVFDLLHPLSVELIYILYCHFELITILKPITSRPANSERCIDLILVM